MAPSPPWADLPQELLSTIANSLYSDPFGIPTFRSVCRSWNSSAPPATPPHILSPPLPLTIPAPSGHPTSASAVLSVTVICSLHAPSQDPLFAPTNWIAFVDQIIKDKVSCRKPFSKHSFKVPFNFPENLNLMDFRPIKLGRFYNLTRVYRRNHSSELNIRKPETWHGEAVKVVLLSNMSAVVMLYGEGVLRLHRLGTGDLEGMWETIHYGVFRFDDVVEYKGRVLAVNRRGRVYEIVLDNPPTINSVVPPIAGGGGRRKRVVESLGELYLVVRCNNVVDKDSQKNAAFKVYRLLVRGEKKKWSQVRDLGGMVFLFGLEFSLSTSTQLLGGCYRENCIVFEGYSFHEYFNKTADTVFSALRGKDLRIGVCHLDDTSHIGVIGSCPGYSELLWPPPSWIWPIDRLKRLEKVETAVDEILMTVPDSLKGKLQEAGDGAFYEALTRQDQFVLAFFEQVHKLKILLNQMKEFDNALTRIGSDAVNDNAPFAKLSIQVQACLPVKRIYPFYYMLEKFANQVYNNRNGDSGNLEGELRSTTFNGLILSLEECFSEVIRRLYLEQVVLISTVLRSRYLC